MTGADSGTGITRGVNNNEKTYCCKIYIVSLRYFIFRTYLLSGRPRCFAKAKQNDGDAPWAQA
jgi:hypothetical protein